MYWYASDSVVIFFIARFLGFVDLGRFVCYICVASVGVYACDLVRFIVLCIWGDFALVVFMVGQFRARLWTALGWIYLV